MVEKLLTSQLINLIKTDLITKITIIKVITKEKLKRKVNKLENSKVMDINQKDKILRTQINKTSREDNMIIDNQEILRVRDNNIIIKEKEITRIDPIIIINNNTIIKNIITREEMISKERKDNKKDNNKILKLNKISPMRKETSIDKNSLIKKMNKKKFSKKKVLIPDSSRINSVELLSSRVLDSLTQH